MRSTIIALVGGLLFSLPPARAQEHPSRAEELSQDIYRKKHNKKHE